MTNHVHLIAVPETSESLALALGHTHRHYTRYINFREGWRGYLWQGRFSSYPLDEKYLHAAVRYVEQNPMKAGLVRKAEDYLWSSAKAHVYKSSDLVLSKFFLIDDIQDWSAFLSGDESSHDNKINQHLRTGRPLGGDGFIRWLETATGRILQRQKPGPKSSRILN